VLLLDDLYFPNGLALSNDQSYLVFAETTAFRISKYVLSGQKKGKRLLVIKDLPGAPDNLKFNHEGLLWVALPSWKSKLSDTLSKSTVARTMLAKFPEWLRKNVLIERKFAGGVVINVETESIVKFVRTNRTEELLCITTMLQKGGKIYLGSIMHKQIGIVAT
jgi:sugar lactone lactonase YvrE